MAYTVLARKYRPQTFSDLVGQEHVTRTLGNAIASGRVAHAFLFTGVRGVGKTTTARILAKALNCATRGPTSEPCGTCDPCREITTGVDLDVLEIDGASNNSVEDVRRLQETIPFRPARDRFKIVIVDEVHMLSTGAFNAFLKTLEEPPPHVKFIFATTESHKVPITIRSRCQRYDFRLIPQSVVAARVRDILGREGIQADDAAVAIVAREAAGSMRDALTLLDQIVAFAGTTLVGEEVARVLGIADRDLLHRASAAVLEGDGAGALGVVDALATRGLDMLHFSKALTELMRDLVVLKVAGPGTELVALVEEERRKALDLVERVEELEMQRAFASLSLLVDEIAKASMPRLALEMGLVRLATRPPLRAIAEIVARLDALQSGRPAGPAPSGPRGGGGGGGRGGGGGTRTPRATAAPDDASALIERLRGPGARIETAERRAVMPAADDAEEEPAPAASASSSGGLRAPAAHESAEPSSAGATPTGPVASAVAPVASAVAPVASAVAPVASAVAPVASAVAPVASAVAPVASAVAPVASAVAPVASAVVPVATSSRPGATSSGPAASVVAPGATSSAPVASELRHEVTRSGPVSAQSAPAARPVPPVDPALASVDALFQALSATPRPAPASRPAPAPAVPAFVPAAFSPAVAPAPAPAVAPAPAPAPAVAPAPAPAPAPSRAAPPDADATTRWETVVAVLMETRPALGSVLLHASPSRVGRDEIVIAFPSGSFYRRQADAPDARAAIAEIAERVLGARPSVRVIERDAGDPGGQTIAELEAERQRARWEATKKKALNHPMVVEALSVFETRPDAAEVRLEGD
ncbi:DNA polymerase III subunit gamma/tau [Sandaracinus amylolyticus]|uniref:DNA polymerase III subunit gamma/tau n=1 Tax=Sandaracinus amylolyticus TaxID=927083 RepID=UPI001F021D61|nr:DNA polymerase III subunit gamma/tau [Sandaracinus amylolyticus]UJR79549.1 DNA polymerase III subunits gamma and tau [Sandaracinus amylolyticus]